MPTLMFCQGTIMKNIKIVNIETLKNYIYEFVIGNTDKSFHVY